MQPTLTPQLTDVQIKQNIDALKKSGMATDKIQAYVDNYSKDTTGNYVLKGSQTQGRNALQSTLGTFLDPIIESGVHAGQAVADLGLRGINKVTGGALDKMTPEGNLNDALARTENTPVRVPVLGTEVKPASQITAENTVGDAVKTVALGVDAPVLAGSLIAGGDALSKDKSAGDVAVNTVVGAIGGKVLEYGFNAVSPYIEKAALKYGQPFLDKIEQYIPESAKGFMTDLSAKVGSVTDKKILPDAVSSAVDKTQSVAGDALDAITGLPKQGVNAVQSEISKASAPPNLEASVDRLATIKPENPQIGNTENPLALYDKYAKQEALYKRDGKADMAISKVGEDLGTAYDKVVQLRKDAGKTMGEEMKAIGSTKTDIGQSFPKFETELHDSGVTYDPKKQQVVLSKTSKITTQDAKMLNTYIKELNSLGANPTAQELDAFLSRVPNNLDVFKSANNIVKVTNGERMIRMNLRELSQALSPDANKAFTTYAGAKAKYAELSQFLKEGQGIVGKKTSTGDYAKDASLLKSAVTSVLNNGKKDWLLKLEEITGAPILDKTILAIQAMKDAGNLKGSSLLDVLNPSAETKIPTSKSGIIDKVVGGVVKKGKEKLAGTPAEQTRRFIIDRMKSVIK